MDRGNATKVWCMIQDNYNTPTYKVTKKTIEQFSSLDCPATNIGKLIHQNFNKTGLILNVDNVETAGHGASDDSTVKRTGLRDRGGHDPRHHHRHNLQDRRGLV